MDPKLEKKIELTYKLARENHQMLKAIRRNMFWSSLIKGLYLVVIVVIAAGAYIFLQPYVEAVLGTYNAVLEGVDQVKGIGDSVPNFGDFFNKTE